MRLKFDNVIIPDMLCFPAFIEKYAKLAIAIYLKP